MLLLRSLFRKLYIISGKQDSPLCWLKHYVFSFIWYCIWVLSKYQQESPAHQKVLVSGSQAQILHLKCMNNTFVIASSLLLSPSYRLDVLTFLALSFSLSGYSSGFVDNTEPPRGNREDNTLFFIRRDAHDEDFLLCLLLSSPCFTAHALRCYTDIEATQITRCKESEGFRTCFTKYNDSKFFLFFSNHNLVLYFN